MTTDNQPPATPTTDDVLDQLIATRSSLTQLIIHTSPAPGDADGAKTLADLIAKREQVSGSIAQLLATDIAAGGATVAKAAQQLASLNQQLNKLAKTIADAKTAIGITSQALGAVAQLVAALA
jgi:hypothetical protein